MRRVVSMSISKSYYQMYLSVITYKMYLSVCLLRTKDECATIQQNDHVDVQESNRRN